MTNGATFYPGIGADEAIAELQNLVGQITAFWAQVEDGLFQLFVVAIVGKWVEEDIRPYRAAFFTFSSYEGKMRLVHNAMKARFGENETIMAEWRELEKSLDNFSGLRNEIAHLIPQAKYSTDPNAKAIVRLVHAFWKRFQVGDFDKLGYSVDELWQALGPYWGYHPRIHGQNLPRDGHQLGYRLEQFTKKLDALPPPPQGGPATP